MATIKIIDGGKKKGISKLVKDLEPFEVAEIVACRIPGDVGRLVMRTTIGDDYFEMIDIENGGYWNKAEAAMLVRPLTEPITIQISND